MTGRLASLAYHLAPDESGSLRVIWEGASDHTAESLLDSHSEGPTALSAAQDLLRSVLADGPKPASVVEAEARAAGLSRHTLRRACRALGIRPRKDGYHGAWFWGLAPSLWDSPHCPLSLLREGSPLGESARGVAVKVSAWVPTSGSP